MPDAEVTDAAAQRPFVGRDTVLASVDATWDHCTAEGTTRMVVLEGHAGIGKTRIVQEFYAALAARQPAPPEGRQPFWPPRLEQNTEGGSALAARSEITPQSIIWDKDVLPAFAWMGIRGTLAERALPEAVQVMKYLNEPTYAPIGRTHRVLTAVWHLALVYAVLLAVVLGFLHFGGPIGDTIGVTIGVIGAIAGPFMERKLSWRELKEERAEKVREATKVELDISSWFSDESKSARGRAEQYFAALRRRGIPGVVVVDDAVLVDDDTIELIESILTLDGPVLVLATAQSNPLEQQLDARAGFGRLVRDHTARTTRIRLGDLSEEALVDLVRSRAPNTTFEIADVIATHAAGNPLVLGGLLDSLPIRRTLSNGSYQIDDPEEVVAGLPDSYEGTLTAYWNQLPDEIRQLLAIASLHGLLVEVGSVRNGYQAAFDVNELVVEHFLAQARTPHSWLADVDDFLDRFTDGALLGIASMNQERVGRSVVPTARRAMIDDLRTRRADTPAWTALNADARRVLLKFYFSVVEEGIEDAGTPIAPKSREAADVAVELAELTDRPREAGDAASYAEAAMEWAADDRDIVRRARALAARRHLECGHLATARTYFSVELEDREHRLGGRARETLETRYFLAEVTRREGHAVEALSLFEHLLADETKALRSDDELVEETRSGLAQSLHDAGRYRQAQEIFESMVAHSGGLRGDDDHKTLLYRLQATTSLAASGRLTEALDRMARLVADQERLFSADHPDTLKTRHAYAGFKLDAGHLDAAIRDYQALFDDRCRILGPGHPDTLTTRHALLSAKGDAGRLAEATRGLGELLQTSGRVLGPYHPMTLTTHQRQLRLTAEGGKLAQSLEGLQGLQATMGTQLGEDHPLTLSVKGSVGNVLAAMGRSFEAAETYRSLVRDRERVFGPELPETLQARNNLALCMSGERDGHWPAIEAWEALLSDQTSILGADHPLTLETRHYLFTSLSRVDPQAAVEQFRLLVEDRERVQGSEHPDTLRSRENLADCLLLAWTSHRDQLASAPSLDVGGPEPDRAVPEYRALVADQERVLGADHPDTLRTRAGLAEAIAMEAVGLEQLEVAKDELQKALIDQESVLGPDHPSVLYTRHTLVMNVIAIDREEGLSMLQALILDRERVLGPDHPNTLSTVLQLAETLAEQGDMVFEDGA